MHARGHSNRTIMLLAICVLPAALWAVENPFVGTWKLNSAKSVSGSTAPPENSLMKIEAQGNGIHVSRDLIPSRGATGHWEFTASFDGRDYPVVNDPGRDTVALKQIDSHTLEATNKKDGKITSSPRWVVSQDGKTLTLTWQGKTAAGKSVNNLRVYEKQ